MENLIPLVNKLQDAFASVGLAGLDLPQIAVVGSQSSGKSSVLESIVGRDFLPRGSGIVTRRPLVLQLIQTPGSTEYGVFLHAQERRFESFAAIRQEIVAETDRMTGTNKGISNIPINLKIYSPNVLDLTLIDLPGVTKIAVGDQPADIEVLIRNMVMEYITKESCLILAVTPANSDLANSDALQLAKTVDPDGSRTIGVLTKLDLMDEGTDALDILTNKTLPLKHGFVGVVNRSQKDIDSNKDVGSAISKEQQWFASHPVYSDIKEKCGTSFLRERLRTTLMHHIKKHLPTLKQRLQKRLDVVRRELKSMTSPFQAFDQQDFVVDETDYHNKTSTSSIDYDSDPQALQRVILNIIRQFGGAIKTLIDGHDGDIGDDPFNTLSFIAGAAVTVGRNHETNSIEVLDDNSDEERHRSVVELNSAVRMKYVFLESFPKTLISLEDILLTADMDNEIRVIIHNSRGLRAGLFVPDAVMEILIKRHILQLERPAMQCVEHIHEELQRMIRVLLDHPTNPVYLFPALREWMMEATFEVLELCREPAIAEVKRLIRMETSYINTGHPDFVGRHGITEFFLQERQRQEQEKEFEDADSSVNINDESRVDLGKNGRQGWLLKQGGARKTWKKRWFVLSDATLSFYNREDDDEEKGSFALEGCLVRDIKNGKIMPASRAVKNIPQSGYEEADENDRACLLEILSKDGSILFRNHENLVLMAANEQEKSAWIRTLTAAITGDQNQPGTTSDKKPPTPPDSPHKGQGSALERMQQFNKVKVSTKPQPNKRVQNGLMSPVPDQLYASDLYSAQSRSFAMERSQGTVHSDALDAGQSLAMADDTSIALIRMLMHSYFTIVRKHIQDLVPKAIVYMMVNRLKKDVVNILSSKVLGHDSTSKDTSKSTVNVVALLQESDSVREERKAKAKMVELVENALKVIDVEARQFSQAQ